jgi:hypothetical protein
MPWFTQDTAPTQYAEGRGIRFAYRRLGIPGRPPLLFFQHFMGTLDDHDPALSDAFTSDRGELFTRKYERQEDMWMPILFAPTETSQAAGRAYVERIVARAEVHRRPVFHVNLAAHQHWKDSPHAHD